MNKIFRVLLLFGLLAYVAWPLDIVPGPIDDMILMIMFITSNGKKAIEG